MSAALTRKLAAMRKAAANAPAPVFTLQQLQVIHQLAHEAARQEIAAIVRKIGQPTRRGGGCG